LIEFRIKIVTDLLRGNWRNGLCTYGACTRGRSERSANSATSHELSVAEYQLLVMKHSHTDVGCVPTSEHPVMRKIRLITVRSCSRFHDTISHHFWQSIRADIRL